MVESMNAVIRAKVKLECAFEFYHWYLEDYADENQKYVKALLDGEKLEAEIAFRVMSYFENRVDEQKMKIENALMELKAAAAGTKYEYFSSLADDFYSGFFSGGRSPLPLSAGA